MLDDYAAEAGGDLSAALDRALCEAFTARKRALLDRFPMSGQRSDVDSVDLIREDRDGR